MPVNASALLFRTIDRPLLQRFGAKKDDLAWFAEHFGESCEIDAASIRKAEGSPHRLILASRFVLRSRYRADVDRECRTHYRALCDARNAAWCTHKPVYDAASRKYMSTVDELMKFGPPIWARVDAAYREFREALRPSGETLKAAFVAVEAAYNAAVRDTLIRIIDPQEPADAPEPVHPEAHHDHDQVAGGERRLQPGVLGVCERLRNAMRRQRP